MKTKYYSRWHTASQSFNLGDSLDTTLFGIPKLRNTVVDGGMEIKGSERESKHLNPIWIIKDSHSIPHYHDYMQIGRTNL